MEFEILPIAGGMLAKHAAGEIMKCNDYTRRFGLALTPEQAVELVETRAHALSDNGRLEFGAGITEKLIKAFCDSPYIAMHNYAPVLHELTEIFYLFKNETLDLVSDDELLGYMKDAYDGVCQGSLELLAGRELYRMAENLRFGRPADSIPEQEAGSCGILGQEEDEDAQ